MAGATADVLGLTGDVVVAAITFASAAIAAVRMSETLQPTAA